MKSPHLKPPLNDASRNGRLSGATWPPQGHGPPGSAAPGHDDGPRQLRVHPGDEGAARRAGVEERTAEDGATLRRPARPIRPVPVAAGIGGTGAVVVVGASVVVGGARSCSTCFGFGVVVGRAARGRAGDRGSERESATTATIAAARARAPPIPARKYARRKPASGTRAYPTWRVWPSQ